MVQSKYEGLNALLGTRTRLAVHFRLCTTRDTFDFSDNNRTCTRKKTYFEQDKKIYNKNRGYLVVWHSILFGRWLNIFRLLDKWKWEKKTLCKEFGFCCCSNNDRSRNQMLLNCLTHNLCTIWEFSVIKSFVNKRWNQKLSLPI